jgi:hypothetical protein
VNGVWLAQTQHQRVVTNTIPRCGGGLWVLVWVCGERVFRRLRPGQVHFHVFTRGS